MAKELQLLTGTSRDGWDPFVFVIFPSVIFRCLQQQGLTVNKCQYIKYCMWSWAQTPVMTRRVAFGTEMFGINSTICTCNCITKMH